MKFNKYAQHGDYHWRQYARGGGYKAHVDFIKQWVKEKKVLDVGAGDGCITHALGAKGIEYEPDGVKIAQEHGADVIQGDAHDLPFEDNSFEAVVMIDSIEHLEDPIKALKEARRVAPVLYIHTPPLNDNGKVTDRFHFTEWTPQGLQEMVESVDYKLDGAMLVYPKGRLMYAKFI